VAEDSLVQGVAHAMPPQPAVFACPRCARPMKSPNSATTAVLAPPSSTSSAMEISMKKRLVHATPVVIDPTVVHSPYLVGRATLC
jgi:hypothetical protein